MATDITYAPGEKRCEKCGDPLGEISCTTDKKHFLCRKPECCFPANLAVPIQFIGAGERLCDAPGCTDSVPPRAYPANRKLFFCRPKCANRYRSRRVGSIRVQCSYCGATLIRTPSRVSERSFCQGHGALYRRDALDRNMCGQFLDVFQRYVKEFLVVHYRSRNQPYHEVRQFLAFLNRTGVTSLDDVRPSHISGFIVLRRKTKQCPRADFVKIFFDYLAEVGLYDHPNPVRSKMHYTPQPEAEPRPYDKQTMEQLWKWVDERGDTRAKLILAFGEEFGPRGIEVCNIHLEDIDAYRQRVWIRNPTKNLEAGWAPFGNKTAKYLAAWLAERDPECGHDFLLTNAYGNPLRTHSMRDLMNGILCKKSKFRQYKEGLDSFSFHALRHTNTTELRRRGVDSQVNMKIHRWKTPAAMQRYDQVLTEEIASEYRAAMDRVIADEQNAPKRSIISMAQLLATRSKEAV